MITGQSKNPEHINEKFKQDVKKIKENGIDENHFNRIKKKIYGDYIAEYNDVGSIARMFLADNFKGINSFDYLEQYTEVTKEYAQQVLKEVVRKENQIISIVEGK